MVNIGNVAGATAQLPAGLLRGQQLTLSGFARLLTPLLAKRPALTWLWSALAVGDLSLDVRTCGLDELPAAWRAQATLSHGKCVIVPDDAHRLGRTVTSGNPTHYESETDAHHTHLQPSISDRG